ncbi:hypothetical protein SHPE106448_06150 [Shewanella pealeana]
MSTIKDIDAISAIELSTFSDLALTKKMGNTLCLL